MNVSYKMLRKFVSINLFSKCFQLFHVTVASKCYWTFV